MSESAKLPLPQFRRLGQTSRRDAWWVQPAGVFAGLMAFIVYSTWAAHQGDHYWLASGGADYLSPFYSPEIFGSSPHSWFGEPPAWLMRVWPSFLPFSPAILILWAPGGFRLTCYYYRGAYYKAFWADPPSCAVGEPAFRRKRYRGEHSFPLILQNIHRYFLFIAIGFIFLLFYDAYRAFWFLGIDGRRGLGVGVGTIVLLINPILLSLYIFGCHTLRHIMGGKKDCISSCPKAMQGAYRGVTCLNRRHMLFAWLSLFWVGFADAYVRLCSMGLISDWRLL
ncbi:MAG: succinate dehydrogenase [Phycisphaerae bacterium]|nr:succinate dehydrogenase [Phycisphaerae bacterium]